MALGSKAVRGLALWRELRQLPDWRGSCRGRALVLRARARQEGQRRLLRRFAVVALALAARYELDPDLSLQGSRLSLTLTDPAGPGITLRALELARELSRLALDFAVPVVAPRRLGLSGRERVQRTSASKPSLAARACGLEGEPTRVPWVDPAGAVLPRLTALGRVLFRSPGGTGKMSLLDRKSFRLTGLVFLGLLALAAQARAQGGLDYLNQADQRRLSSPREKAAELVATGERYLARARSLEQAAEEAEAAPRQAVKIRKEYERAISFFEAALRKDSLTAPAHLGRGEALLALGRREEAGQACQRALQLAPGNGRARLCLVSVRLEEGDLDGARVLCLSAAASYPEAVPLLQERLERFVRENPTHPRRAELAGWLVAPPR